EPAVPVTFRSRRRKRDMRRVGLIPGGGKGVEGACLRGLATVRPESFDITAVRPARLPALRTRIGDEREAGSGQTQQRDKDILHGGVPWVDLGLTVTSVGQPALGRRVSAETAGSVHGANITDVFVAKIERSCARWHGIAVTWHGIAVIWTACSVW